MIETEDDTYQLPNMTEEFDVMKKKLADDVARFTSFQSKRWQDVQEKLDSVHVRKLNILELFYFHF